MNANTASFFRLQRICMTVVAMGLAGLLAACGGGNDPPAAATPPAAAITAQPTDQSVVAAVVWLVDTAPATSAKVAPPSLLRCHW